MKNRGGPDPLMARGDRGEADPEAQNRSDNHGVPVNEGGGI